ncbi:MAG: FHA domain-containing protein, partial [bacterium]|nr:FHA domain-containing protein [bacterium]
GSGQTVEDVLTGIREHHLPIYAMGFSTLPENERPGYLEVLHRFAAVSGGIYRNAGEEDFSSLYSAMQESIIGVQATKAICEECVADGRLERLQVSLTSGSKVLTDGLDLRLLPGSKPQSQDKEPPAVAPTAWWARPPVFISGGGLAIGLALLLWWKMRAREPEPEETGVTPSAETGADPPPFPVVEPPPSLLLKLDVVRGPRPGESYEVRLGEAILGRAEDCDLRMDGDDTVSSHHLRICFREGMVVVEDNDSANGTQVNGAPIA